MRGEGANLDSSRGTICLKVNGQAREVLLASLKAVFFLRSPGADPIPEKVLSPAAKKVKVVFADGEEMTGYTYGLRPSETGFFIFPVRTRDQNRRVFIVKENALRIQTLPT